MWKLCEQVKKTNPNELERCYAVFVSNVGRTVPLWRQKVGRGDDKVVIWVNELDYPIFTADTSIPHPLPSCPPLLALSTRRRVVSHR